MGHAHGIRFNRFSFFLNKFRFPTSYFPGYSMHALSSSSEVPGRKAHRRASPLHACARTRRQTARNQFIAIPRQIASIIYKSRHQTPQSLLLWIPFIIPVLNPFIMDSRQEYLIRTSETFRFIVVNKPVTN